MCELYIYFIERKKKNIIRIRMKKKKGIEIKIRKKLIKRISYEDPFLLPSNLFRTLLLIQMRY